MRYNQYIDSNVDWIGPVPSTWHRLRIKFGVRRSAAGVWGSDEKGDRNDVACFRIADFDYNHGILKLDNITLRNIEKSQLEGRLLSIGDLLIEKSGGGDATPVGRVVRVNYEDKATCSNFVHSISLNEKLDSNFMYYYFHYLYANKVNLLFFNQTTGLQNLKVADYLSQSIYVPTFIEQKEIASYLDNKCKKIDNVIAAQQKRIELLQELKQSIITRAVTQGINPNVKLKDSEVVWINSIPQNWIIAPLKSIGKMYKGVTFTKAELVDEGNPVISYGQIHSKENKGTKLNESLIRYIPNGLIQNAHSSLAGKGDFIFADTSEDLEGSGNAVYIDKDCQIYGGYHTIVFRTESVQNKYFAYLFLTDSWRSQIRSRVSGVKVYSITQSILSTTKVIIPPPEEQQVIANYLDNKCNKIDSSIAKARHQIDLLKEYKQSLITEVVTGKRKVC